MKLRSATWAAVWIGLLALAAGVRLIRAVPGTALLAFERTHLLFASNLPRVLTVALAFGVAAAGGDLAVIALIGAVGEVASLAIALFAAAAVRSSLSGPRSHRLAEGI